MVVLNKPLAPATKKQLFMIHQLTGEDTRELELTMQEASDRIEELELDQTPINETPVIPTDGLAPFSEAHVTLIEGAQRSGKTTTAVGKVRDSYDNDCVRIYCEDILKIKVDVKGYDRKSRLAKIKYQGETQIIKIPESYTLYTPKRIFSNIHLYGMKYVYCPSFRHILYWLKKGIICKGWLIIDESQRGMNARSTMSELGKELEVQGFQFGKMQLDVIIITHMARLIDWAMRTIPTEHISCTYNKKTKKVTYSLKKKGQQGTKEVSYYAPKYWGNHWTNEKVNA